MVADDSRPVLHLFRAALDRLEALLHHACLCKRFPQLCSHVPSTLLCALLPFLLPQQCSDTRFLLLLLPFLLPQQCSGTRCLLRFLLRLLLLRALLSIGVLPARGLHLVVELLLVLALLLLARSFFRRQLAQRFLLRLLLSLDRRSSRPRPAAWRSAGFFS